MKRFSAFLAVITLSVMILWAGIGVAFVRCNHSGFQRLGFVAEANCCEATCCDAHHNADGNDHIESGCMTLFFAKIADFSVDNTQMPSFDAVQHAIINNLSVHFCKTHNLSNRHQTHKFYPPPRLYLTLINILII